MSDLQSIINRFKASAKEIETLSSFDHDLRQLIKLKSSHYITDSSKLANFKSFIDDVNHDENIIESYKIIFTHSVVLLVSHFSAALSDYFKFCFTNIRAENEKLNERINLTLEDIYELNKDNIKNLP
ncbi:MAG: hypothetical protein ACRBDX_07860 [Gammaproteobacteria bacterium]